MRLPILKRPMNWPRMSMAPLTMITATLPVTAGPAVAAPAAYVIALPAATSIEGIAKGAGSSATPTIRFLAPPYQGDLQRGTAELFIGTPDGRMTLCMSVDIRHGPMFVTGGPGWSNRE